MKALVELWWRFKDERRRARKRLPELEAADLVLVSHAKSGRTWLLAMISHVFHLTRGVPVDELWDGDNFHLLDPAIPRLYATHERNEPAPVRRRLPELVRDRRLLLLFRDPRDVIVSPAPARACPSTWTGSISRASWPTRASACRAWSISSSAG